MAIATALMSAEEYCLLPDYGEPTELVRGIIVPMNMPFPRHGEICCQTIYLLRRFLEAHDVGRVVSNDSGIVTQRAPDTVRGADVAFYSYVRVPRGPLPRGYLPVAPDVAFELRSPTDRWTDILAKVAEYLIAGVRVVCVLDEQTETAHVYHADQEPRILTAAEELTLPEPLDGLRVLVQRFFE